MQKIFVALSILLIPLLSYASGSGYGNTKWDMRPSEVMIAQGNGAHLIAPEKYKGSVGKVRIDNVKIGSDLYTINFLFDDYDHLVQTNITSNEKENEGVIALQYDRLSKLLTQKYGKPEYSSSESVTWKLPSTTVELCKLIISGVIAQTTIRYVPNGRISKDTSNL